MSGRPALELIVAMDRNRVIGHGGGIPWHHREDMRHFRRTTLHHAVIMGRGTFESMGKPLAKRRNIVVSRQRDLSLPGCETAASVPEAIARARETDDAPIVIGGAQIYAEALPQVTRIHLTIVPGEHAGDTFFPVLDPRAWHEAERRKLDDELELITLDRVAGK